MVNKSEERTASAPPATKSLTTTTNGAAAKVLCSANSRECQLSAFALSYVVLVACAEGIREFLELLENAVL
ncbi:unnamed protein product [Cylicostephanus goldi]|uniref:Uncharacterized protein n=1 Tax=Cylicostephanus goldi TaxID=71465 RepID=A0A3P6UN33_CYLGO|nr:unnamed protein product [Cylicostephanus goldi]